MRRMYKYAVLPTSDGGRPFFHIEGSCRPVAGGVELTTFVNGRDRRVSRPAGSPHEAVWRGVELVVRFARRNDLGPILIRTRSEHVRNQAKGRWGVDAPALQPIALKVAESEHGYSTMWC